MLTAKVLLTPVRAPRASATVWCSTLLPQRPLRKSRTARRNPVSGTGFSRLLGEFGGNSGANSTARNSTRRRQNTQDDGRAWLPARVGSLRGRRSAATKPCPSGSGLVSFSPTQRAAREQVLAVWALPLQDGLDGPGRGYWIGVTVNDLPPFIFTSPYLRDPKGDRHHFV